MPQVQLGEILRHLLIIGGHISNFDPIRFPSTTIPADAHTSAVSLVRCNSMTLGNH